MGKIRYTIKELIQELEKLPQDLPVFTNGYESGYENIKVPKIVKFEYKENAEYWDGEFQTAENEEKGLEAVILEREVRKE